MTAKSVARIAESPVGLIVLGTVGVVVGVVIIKNIAEGLFGQNGSFNPENSATDAQGNPVTSYKDVGGVLGWLGAATNTVSGGLLASFGEWISGKVSDLTCGYNPNAPSCMQTQNQPTMIGDSTASTDPVTGMIFADKFRRPSISPHAGSIPFSNQFREHSGAIQSWSARPFQQGNNAAYHDAYDSSPPDPTYTASVLVTSQGTRTRI